MKGLKVWLRWHDYNILKEISVSCTFVMILTKFEFDSLKEKKKKKKKIYRYIGSSPLCTKLTFLLPRSQ